MTNLPSGLDVAAPIRVVGLGIFFGAAVANTRFR